jgi:ketosteroid isomerase-like protein
MANLSYLKHLPADHLKIDMEFIHDISRSETDRRLVAGMVSFAHAFEQVTVAEGVEDEETLMVLRELGVDRGQGYLFGRPAPHPMSGCRAAPREEEAADGVELVKSAFDAFSRRDLDALSKMCTPDLLVYPAGTAALTGKPAGYRGLDGLREYFDDLGSVWGSLELRPRTLRAAEASILVFGEVEGKTESGRSIADVIWVWRISDGLVASVEAFQVPRVAS